MKPRSAEYKHDWRQPGLAETEAGQGGLQNISVTLPEMEILAGHSIEELLDEVERATEEGFERGGSAFFDGDQGLPFRQVMVRYASGPAPPRNISVRKLGR
jgi:hypothetical protein